jgi:hypothetical protein
MKKQSKPVTRTIVKPIAKARPHPVNIVVGPSRRIALLHRSLSGKYLAAQVPVVGPVDGNEPARREWFLLGLPPLYPAALDAVIAKVKVIKTSGAIVCIDYYGGFESPEAMKLRRADDGRSVASIDVVSSFEDLAALEDYCVNVLGDAGAFVAV